MTPPCEFGLRAFHLSLLGAASLLVPRKQRPEWWREWKSELWHVRRACALAGAARWRAEREVAAFCLGAFRDALCLKRYSRQEGASVAGLHGSAPQCLFGLAAVLAVSCGMAVLLPGVRVESHPSRYQVRSGVILIQDANHDHIDESAATISVKQFRNWKGRTQRYFTGLAFYRIGPEAVSTGTDAKAGWEVAHASSNLFSLLGLPVQFMSPDSEGDRFMPRVVLSDEVWKREFHGDPHIIHSVIDVGGRKARIAGVIPDGAWRLPGKADAWLLERDSDLASGGMGRVVAHLTELGQSEMWTSYVQITSHDADSSKDNLWGVSVEERTRGPWGLYLFSVLLAFLALPAITSVSMGEYAFRSHRPSWAKRLCRWGFLSAKVALLLPIVYFLSLDLAYWHSTRYSPASEYIQLASSFLLCLFGMWWALLDQRRRCPVCLRLVTRPAKVGLASRTFLAWNGTEMICMGGHTLLHVPELPTSWFSTQRWLYLDTSWEFLFAGSGGE